MTYGKCTSRYSFYKIYLNLKKIKIKLAIFREAGIRWYVRLDRRFKPADKLNKANEDNTFLTMENYGIVNEESYFNERITYMN